MAFICFYYVVFFSCLILIFQSDFTVYEVRSKGATESGNPVRWGVKNVGFELFFLRSFLRFLTSFGMTAVDKKRGDGSGGFAAASIPI